MIFLCVKTMEPLKWEFECNQCKGKFEQVVPHGPEEERNIKCPECGSKDVKNLSLCCVESPSCGG